MKVVLDTNVIVSRYLSPTGIPAQVFTLWEEKVFEHVTSEAILHEYKNTLFRVLPSYQIKEEEVEEIVTSFRELSIVVEPTQKLPGVSRDPEDIKFIECAVAGNVEYIVSGDRDLLSVQRYKGIHILTPADFLAFVKQRSEKKAA